MSSHYQQWNIPPCTLQLLEHEVHVWRASLEVSELVRQNLECVLSKEEDTKVMRFHFEKDRKHWIVARGILRILLSRYVNTDPSQLRFGSNAYGKPFLAFPFTQARLLPFPAVMCLINVIPVFDYSLQGRIYSMCDKGLCTLQARRFKSL